MQTAQSKAEAVLSDLATTWSKRPPTEVVSDLERLSSEARFLGPGHDDLTRRLCKDLAEIVDRPEDWLEAMLAARLDALRLEPFLARCVRERRAGWETWLEHCLDSEALHWAALEQLLTMLHPDESLVERAIAGAGPFAQLVETLCSTRRVPLSQLRALLSSEDARVSLAAAAGEWDAVPEHTVRPEVSEDWRSAILRIDSEKVRSIRNIAMLEFWLGEILSHDSELATEWLRARLGGNDSDWLGEHGLAEEAICSLPADKRVAVLASASGAFWQGALIRRLVDGDVVVYRRTLKMPHLASFHLDPLHGIPDDAWRPLATAALDAGFSAHDVAGASLAPPHTIASQEELTYWERFKDAFATLSQCGSPELERIGRAGIGLTDSRIARARRNIKALEISGF